MKTEIIYSKNTLFITLEGMLLKKQILTLKRKIYYILNEYGVEDIVIDLKQINQIDKEAFYEFLDEYDIKYGGNLEVVEK